MNDYIEIVTVPIITTIVYWLINLLKYTTKNDERVKQFLPFIAVLLGIASGAIAYFIIPEKMLAPNIGVSMVIGGASGLSSTGFHQLIKTSKEENTEDTD